MEEKHKFKVFSKRKANLLCKKGFTLEGIVINDLKPWLYVYLFEDSEEFRLALKEINENWNQ